MSMLTSAEIDRELVTRETEIDAIATTLVELDKHPGLILVRQFPPTGVTEQRWGPVQEAIALLWEDYARLRTILDSAKAARRRHLMLSDGDRAEITRLLREQSFEVAREQIPLSQRTLTGPREAVRYIGLADILDRMRERFPTVVEFLDQVDTVNTEVAAGVAPLRAELDNVGATTNPALRAIRDGIAELLGRAAVDPLALADEVDERLTELSDQLRTESAMLTELRALVANWDTAVAAVREQLDRVRQIRERTAHARVEVEQKILTGPLPVRPDDTGALRAELDALRPGAAEALYRLRERIGNSCAQAVDDERLIQGLLDRRAELRGRLGAYQAKANRLGVAEERDVMAADRIATGLLSRRPCDLAAVTRAIADYRGIIAQKSGRTS
ncbi:hypothetical protein HLB23_25515 [Nocardia uniformis]|uniref:Uncharacterized protein n=1 Tax=Nocardia uniformis TaxID=53432 RepID=A0A849C3A9_9NOCA|nr:hypothetical protein [Nocardia uniformis]NNH73174.1 hypothetical protein [Nocardia uniformis]